MPNLNNFGPLAHVRPYLLPAMAAFLCGCSASAARVAASPLAEPHGEMECASGDLMRKRLAVDTFEKSLSFSAGPPHHLRIDTGYALSGSCATLVDEAEQGLVRLRRGSVYMFNNDGDRIEPWPTGRGAFDAEGLKPKETPRIPGMRFIDADNYQMAPTRAGQERRYVGLWAGKGRWTVAAFAVSPTGRGEVRCLLMHSKLPLRGLTFFPSPDQPSGGIWLVQEAPGRQIRTIAVGWRHAGVTKEGATAPC